MRGLCVFFAILIAVSACNPSPENLETPTAATFTSTPSPTVGRFASTPTMPVLPTENVIKPTSEPMPPASSKAIIEQPFNSKLWRLSATQGSFISFENGVISIGASNKETQFEAESEVTLPSNFYLTIKVNLSFCDPKDFYTIIFWRGSNQGTFALDFRCDAQMRLRLLTDTGSSTLLDWQAVRKLPPQAPVENTIGIWALRGLLTFFANGQYQAEFQAKEDNQGTLQLAAYCTGKQATAINFSNLEIFEP